MIDSPVTPGTPDTPADISTVPAGQLTDPVWSTVSEPVSFQGCQELARAVKYCSRSLVEGTWTEDSTVRGRRPLFRPSDFESAKAFLRASVEVIHTKRQNRSVSDTPLSSRSETVVEMVTCHGCHGRIGQGQHQGSATGKILCTLPHSFYCRGGVVEDVSWRACPTGYIFDPNVDLAGGPGFESTLGSLNFQPQSQHSQGHGPVFSTPIFQTTELAQSDALVAPAQINPLFQVPYQNGSLGAVSRILSHEFPSVTRDIVPHVPGIIQDRINEHRSGNQAASSSADRPAGLDITDLRRDPNLQIGVENVMDGVIRSRIPSLSAAASATSSVETVPDPAVQSNVGTDPGQGHLPGQLPQVPVLPVNLPQPAHQQVFFTAVPQPQGVQQHSPHGATPQQQPVQPQPVHAAGSAFPQQPIPLVVQPPVPAFPQQATSFVTTSQHQPVLPSAPPQQPAQQSVHSGAAPQQPSPHGVAQQQQFVQQQYPPLSQHQPVITPQQSGLQAGYQSGQQQVPLMSVAPHQSGQMLSSSGHHPQHVHPPTPQGVQYTGYQQVPGVQGLTGQFMGLNLNVPNSQQHLGASGGTSHLHSQQAPASVFVGNQHNSAMFQQPTLPNQNYGQLHQPLTSYANPGQAPPGQQNSYCYEWLTDSNGQKILVRTAVPQHGPQAALQQPAAAAHHPQPLQPLQLPLGGQPAPSAVTTPQVSYKLEYRCSPTSGRQWQVQVPIVVSPSPVVNTPQYRNEWRIHPQTGVTFQVQVPIQASQTVTPQPAYIVPAHVPAQHQANQSCQGPSPDVSSQQIQQSYMQHSELQQNSSLTRQDRVAGIVSLLEGGTTKKQPKVLEYAKTCPTRWSKQATLSNINLPLYAWGAVTEIESSLSGRSESMSEAVMLGKLRHLKNTLEVCCLNSTSSEFSAYGWTLAKDYATKVDNEVEQRLATWQDMPAGVRTATLVSAQMENPRPVAPARVEPKKSTVAEKKDLCTTYNNCSTEWKCDYEVANPDKKCIRKHECSYCMKHKKQSWRHQAVRCRAKADAGGH